jgi:hypothetical protein
MSTVLRRLVTVLGFRINKTGLGDYEKSINSIKKNVNQLNLSFNSLKFATRGIFFGNVVLSGVALGVAKTAKSLDDLSEKVGVGIGDIQALELMSQKLGNSYGEITKTMSGFAEQVSHIRNPVLRLNTLQSLMVDKNKKLANVFNQSSESFKKLVAESSSLVNVFSKKNIQDSKEYIKSWAEFRIILDNIRTDIGLSYMPLFNELSLKFKNWYLENRQSIKTFSTIITSVLGKSLDFLSGILGSILTPIGKAISFLTEFDDKTNILSKTISALGGVLNYTFPLFLPFSKTIKIISVAFVGLNAVIQDFLGWVDGIDSVFGTVFGKWESVLNGFTNSLSAVKNSLKGFWQAINPTKTIQEFFTPKLPELNLKKTSSIFSKNINSEMPSFDKVVFDTPNFNNSSSKISGFNEFGLRASNQIKTNAKGSKNVSLNPNFSIRIDNISIADNMNYDQAKSTALNISEIIKKELELTFSDFVNNLTS